MTIKRKLSLFAIPGLLAASAFTFAFLNAPASTLTVDVNPSIELTTNRLDKVVEINPLNSNARSLLEGYTPSDRDLDDVINDLVDRMILKGYITGGQDNVVMISVQDQDADQKLVDRVNKAIAAYLENKQIEATIVNKKLDIAREALNKDGVSSGKLAVVEALMKGDDTLSKEALADMKISELVALAKELNIKPSTLFEAVLDRDDDFDDFDLDDDFDDSLDDDINNDANEDDDKDDQNEDRDDVWDDDRDDRDDNWDKSGSTVDDSTSASVKVTISDNVISAERARTIALQKVNGEIIKLALDDDDDRMEYEVEILSNGIKYEMEIDAVTGSILEFESEADFDDDKAWDDEDDRDYNDADDDEDDYDDIDQDLSNDHDDDHDDDDDDDNDNDRDDD